jgi:hypothetical protein
MAKERGGHDNVTVEELPSMIRVDGVKQFDFDYAEMAEALGWDDFGNDDFEEIMSTHYGRMIHEDDRTIGADDRHERESRADQRSRADENGSRAARPATCESTADDDTSRPSPDDASGRAGDRVTRLAEQNPGAHQRPPAWRTVNRSHPDLFHAGHRRLPDASYRNDPTATLTPRLRS